MPRGGPLRGWYWPVRAMDALLVRAHPPGEPRLRQDGRDVVEHDLRRLAVESVEAFNASDWDTSRRLSADGYVYEDTGTGRRAEGAEALVQLCEVWKQAMPDVRGDVLRVLVDGTRRLWRSAGPARTAAPSP